MYLCDRVTVVRDAVSGAVYSAGGAPDSTSSSSFPVALLAAGTDRKRETAR